MRLTVFDVIYNCWCQETTPRQRKYIYLLIFHTDREIFLESFFSLFLFLDNSNWFCFFFTDLTFCYQIVSKFLQSNQSHLRAENLLVTHHHQCPRNQNYIIPTVLLIVMDSTNQEMLVYPVLSLKIIVILLKNWWRQQIMMTPAKNSSSLFPYLLGNIWELELILS